LRQSREDAERERPELATQARQYAVDTAGVDAEIGRAYELLKGNRMLQKVSLAELAERTGITKSDLMALERQRAPSVSIFTLARVAHALDKELRILHSSAARPATAKREPTMAAR
jgi:DNA-binding Xre family transcriptional regulator